MAGLLLLCNAQHVPDSFTTTTSETPTSTSTTSAPNTTTTTTSPEPPHTTTPAPPTTTPQTTTTMAPPLTTTPVPDPEVGTWKYPISPDNQTCVIVQMAMQLNVTYLNTTNQPTHALYDVPKDARVTNGSCLGDSQFIVLQWPAASKDTQNMLNITFTRNTTDHEFAIAGLSIILYIDEAQFPNAAVNQTLSLENKNVHFKTPMDMSYHCNRVQILNLTTTGQPSFKSTVAMSKLQFEAFHSKHNSKFSIAKDCDAIDTPDIVPIAVGCALILLIVIVLIAYLAGRRNNLNRGYVSM